MARGLDHLVLAARDLDGQMEIYRRLGFTVGRRNRHPWGTLNAIVQFPGCFLELITTEPGFQRPDEAQPVAQFATFLGDYVARRDGFAMLVLESRDAAADQADFQAHGIAGRSTFFFERQGARPDGSPVHVAFTLAFALTPAIDARFFVCQQHYPENFWNPDFQKHANGVTAVAAAVMVAPEPLAHAAFLEAYTGGGRVRQNRGGIVVETPRGAIEVLTPDAVAETYGPEVLGDGDRSAHFVAVRFICPAPAALRDRLAAASVPHRGVGDGLIVVPPSAACGVALAFAAV